MHFLLSAALAAPFFGEPGAPVTLPVGGNWARAFATDDGWDFFFAAGGDYNHLVLPLDFRLEIDDRQRLTGRDDLRDNQIVPCPDGTWLHAASADLETQGDSAYTFRYDAAFQPLVNGTVAEADPSKRLNDMALACEGPGRTWMGAVTDRWVAIVYELPEDDAAPAQVEAPALPFLQGGSFAYEAADDTLLVIGASDGVVRWVRIDPAYAVLGEGEFDLTPSGERAYWPQSVVRAGDRWLLAYMARDDAAGWALDTGNVWIAAFDDAWNLLETRQVSTWSPPNGAMRPALAVRGSSVYVLYDVSTVMYAQEVPILDDGGTPTGDDTGATTAGDDSGASPDGDDSGAAGPGKDTPADGCGCATGGEAGGVGIGLLAAALVRRRARA